MTREAEPKTTVAVVMKVCPRHEVEEALRGVEAAGAEAEDDLPIPIYSVC
jgi:hypothetical protein